MKKQLKALSLVALGLSLSVSGQEQQKDSVSALDEVVLYGLKVPQKEALIGKNITVLNESDIQAYKGYSLAQLINTVSGITVHGAQLPMGNPQSVYARGGRSKQVLLLIDGIRVADPYSASLSYDLRLLDLSNIKQIELLKGASSAVYGSSASTVVIAITTKDQQQTALTLRSGLGSNQTAEDQNMKFYYKTYGLNYSGSIDKLHYRLNYSNVLEDGVSALEQTTEADPFKRSQLSLLIHNDTHSRFSWKLKSSYTDMSISYDDSFNAVDEAFKFLTKKTSIGFQSNYRLSKGSLFLGLNHNQFNSEAISSYPGNFESASSNLDFYYKKGIGSSTKALVGVQSSIDQSKNINDTSITTIDPYLSLFVKSNSGLNLNTAVRLNHHQTYGNHWVGHFNPSFSFGTDKNNYIVYTSVGTAFISPSLFQLYGDWGANKELTPEENTTYEIGLKGSSKSTNWNILAFKRNEVNAVYWNSESFQYDNSEGKSEAKGVEFDSAITLSDAIQFNLNYTYLIRDKELMIRIPKHKVNLSTSYRLGAHQFLLETQYVGKRYDTDFSSYTDLELNPYTLVNLNWNTALSDKVSLQFGIRNLFNTSFIEQIGYQTLGRNYRFNISYSLF